MIELLLQAERALGLGLVDQAERLYRQAADADPQNSIAVVGLARVALERGDEPEAWRQARRALGIDPENVAAQRLALRLEEVWAYRGESPPDVAARPDPGPGPGTVASAGRRSSADPGPSPTPAAVAPPPDPGPPPALATPGRSVVDRLLRRKRP